MEVNLVEDLTRAKMEFTENKLDLIRKEKGDIITP